MNKTPIVAALSVLVLGSVMAVSPPASADDEPKVGSAKGVVGFATEDLSSWIKVASCPSFNYNACSAGFQAHVQNTWCKDEIKKANGKPVRYWHIVSTSTKRLYTCR